MSRVDKSRTLRLRSKSCDFTSMDPILGPEKKASNLLLFSAQKIPKHFLSEMEKRCFCPKLPYRPPDFP